MKKYIAPTMGLKFFEKENILTVSNVNAWSTMDDNVLTDAGITTQPRIIQVNVANVKVF
jgi:hypothetical protein